MKHPNAATAGGVGGAGAVIVWLLGHLGIAVSAEEGALIGAGAATVALFIGRKGIRGALRMIWRGDGT